MFIEISLLFLALLLWVIWKDGHDSQLENFPQEPPGLPVIGHLHLLGSEPYKTFTKLRKTYGDTFSMRLGKRRAIILNNHKDIREAFSNPQLCGRPQTLDTVIYCGGAPRGVLGNTGQTWLEQRRFVLKTLKDFGFGQKKSVEPFLVTECQELLDTFENLAKEAKPFQVTHIFNAAVLNVVWNLVTGQRFSRDDPALMDAIETLTTFVIESRQASPRVFFPILDKLCTKLPGSFGMLRNKTREKLQKLVEESLLEHEKNPNEGEEPRDFMDVYLKEIAETTHEASSFFGEEGRQNLIVCAIDLFVAGSETTSTTLSWLYLLLAIHPKVQEKVYEEIVTIVGTSRMPSLQDRTKMRYTEAVINEVLRFSSMVPLSLIHDATEDTTFKGYRIPKGTYIIPNMHGVLHDPEIWGDPDNFRPERFLSPGSEDEADQGQSQVRYDAWMPFSTGKRICIGQTLAQNELFAMTTSVLQRFRVELAEGEDERIEYHPATVLIPKPKMIRVFERN